MEGMGIFENAPDAWKNALLRLHERGYTELSEAIRTGLLDKVEADRLTSRGRCTGII